MGVGKRMGPYNSHPPPHALLPPSPPAMYQAGACTKPGGVRSRGSGGKDLRENEKNVILKSENNWRKVSIIGHAVIYLVTI